MPEIVLCRIVAPHFVAGIVLYDGIVRVAAPIVGYMRGWQRERVESYIASKRWGFHEAGREAQATIQTGVMR